METTQVSMLDFLRGPLQFSVPIFRRRYSWRKKDCQRLLNDILHAGSDDEIKTLFLGTIIYIDRHVTPIGAVRKLIVIDGHQRLATLSLLLSALSLAIEEKKDKDIGTSVEELQNYFFNDQGEELRYKLLLTKDDKETFIALLENRRPTNPSSVLVENHEFLKNRLKNFDLKTLHTGLEKLEVVSVVLDPANNGDPKQIFETLNSTEDTLSEADRIRNYVLMDLELTAQERLFENYWFPMQQLFADEYAKHSDPFIRNYLTLKMGQVPSHGKVYDKFKECYPINDNPEQLESIVKEILHYAQYYVKMVLLTDRDRELWKCFSDIAKLQTNAPYPFLLQVYNDYNQGRIEKSEVIKILRIVESYVFRRAVCGVSTVVMNKVFASLMNEVDKDNYLESLNDAFLGMDTNKRYPKDLEFKETFIHKDVYNFKNKRDYLLDKLENHERKEPIEVSDYTIEHIMPQNLTEQWKRELGTDFQQIHQRWLHKIGNLTLTGYNREYSNHTFKEKRDLRNIGLRYSPLHLNQSFANTEEWNESAIIDRAKELAEKACKIWIDLSR